jgi:prepilin-type N-terminal cleavage/methylation domain-containing protein
MMTTTINSRRKGFTLAELLVAMGITAIILTLLVSVTGVALDGWRISRNKVRASRQAKAALDQLSRDFESMVVRSGNEFEWLFSESEADPVGPTGGESPNAARLIFFSAATDRYDGKIDDPDSKGDVSAVGYGLFYTDPIAGADSDYSVFALYRQLVNPDVAFEDLLAKDDLSGAFGEVEDDTSNFLCENIYQISVVFMIEFTEEDGGKLVTQFERVPVLAKGGGAESVDSFRIRGNGIRINGETEPDYARGRVISVDLSVSVITDAGIATMRKANFSETDKKKFLAKNTYNYIKTILLPQP